MNRKNQALKLVFISIAVFAIALLYFFFDARQFTFFPKCPFYVLTGLYCPGCGSQRAISSLLHGEILPAIHFNLLLVTCLPLLFYSAVISVANYFNKRQIIKLIFYSPLFVKTFLVVVVCFAIVRNIPVAPFTLIAPH
jgi:hypothetical protein